MKVNYQVLHSESLKTKKQQDKAQTPDAKRTKKTRPARCSGILWLWLLWRIHVALLPRELSRFWFQKNLHMNHEVGMGLFLFSWNHGHGRHPHKLSHHIQIPSSLPRCSQIWFYTHTPWTRRHLQAQWHLLLMGLLVCNSRWHSSRQLPCEDTDSASSATERQRC